MDCNPKNKRLYQRCLKNFLNHLRQLQGQSQLKTIAKFKKQFNVDTKDKAFEIAALIYDSSKRKYPSNDFHNLTNMRDVYRALGGETVRTIYIVNNATIKETVYDVPDDEHLFTEWWNSKMWDWKVSSNTLFEEEGEGDVFITPQLQLTPTIIAQSYLDNEMRNCVFYPIVTHCEKQLENPLLAASTQKKYNVIINKINRLLKVYTNGVPDDHLDKVFKKLLIKMTLVLPFSNRKLEYGEQNIKKYIMAMSYLNTRLNHLELAGEYVHNNPPQMVEREVFDDLIASLEDDKKFYIYQAVNENKYHLKTIDGSYRLKPSGTRNLNDVSFDFEDEFGLSYMYLDDVKDKLLSKFVRCGAHMTTSKINPAYKNTVQNLTDKFKEIDCIKAYTQFKKCSFYEGFVGKITDFRATDAIEGVGFYIIGNIDWTHATKKLKHIQRVFDIYRGRNIFASAELRFLMSHNAKFKIKGGCWGVPVDFHFTEEMFEKDGENIPNYSRWTGQKNARNAKNIYYMNTKDTEYAQHIMDECSDAQYDFDKGVMRFTTDKDVQRHMSQISSYIYAYQRLNLMDQLLKMDVDKIIRINTDGIKYLPHKFEKTDIFRIVSEPNVNGLTMGEREEGFITNINCCNRVDWIAFHLQFARTGKRSHYDNELFIGKGGCGKTHMNLIDKGLVRLLYVAPSYKLIRAKAIEYNGIDTEVLANLLSPNRHKHILRTYNTILVDEASMINEETRKNIFSMYKHCKLIFCGDLGYQADPVEGVAMNAVKFENIRQFTVNHRCKDVKLERVLNHIRGAIEECGQMSLNKYDLKHIKRDEVPNLYKVHDIILTHTHKTRGEYDKIVTNDKFIITKSCDKYSRGEIHYEKPSTKNCEKSNSFTTHSIQGETFHDNIFIDEELLRNKKLFYTAMSRAVNLNQINLVTH